ncbi:hypothetical protein GRS48_00580 [Halorubrum sp. JWXQ-INN 858]|uniref:D-aminoacyl-tRNA deacylase n=1 Tax=Halorubrum sp. JWXQ-INN 858 TaxID=2690782 RepID=UPI0013F8BD36|nr:D-aminoacyl-tRNA deacylase [Halorubrum sp. JWXQ-INN 858]MWV63329.1 hypothetical protein [Halorubrum sp. JWXQ-INN 858]
MIAIVVSRADSASEHIGEHLLELEPWAAHEDGSRPDGDGGGTYYRTEGFELRSFDGIHVSLDDPAPAFGGGDEDDGDDGDRTAKDGGDAADGTAGPDLLVFVSRHSGDTGPLLTAHFTGNFGPAEYGGDDGGLARAAPGTQKRVVDALARHAPDGYDVGIEGTHHGPTDVSVPSLFVELGSDEPQWADEEAARAVARAVLDLRDAANGGRDGDGTSEPVREHGDDDPSAGPDLLGTDGEPRHVVGFGGGHYAPRFTRIVAETEWAVGHVGVDWALAAMGAPEANRDVIARAFERSRAEHAVIEGDRPALAAVIEDLGYRVVGETWVRAVGDRPLALVSALEEALCPVDDGLRFGDVLPSIDRTAEGTPSPDRAPVDPRRFRDAVVVRRLPGELLARAQGIDAEAARAAVRSRTVAFETEQAGTVAAGRAAFPAGADGYARLVADLVDVLRGRYDEVAIEGGAVVAREAAFDPALAARRGVPEGPAFGRLSAGEPVEVDGEVVTPADVTRSTADRFPVAGDALEAGERGTGDPAGGSGA